MGYLTVKKEASDEFVERKSRFIGHCAPVTTEEQAMEFVSRMKSRYKDATHNVYAYILREGGLKRYSDDGEPQGTAGVPVLDVLEKQGLTDVAVVVTRYFGGIMLGAGGLVRAYSAGARIGVAAAGIARMENCDILELELEYSLYGKLQNILPGFKTLVLSTDFTAAVQMRLLMQDRFTDRFIKEVLELSAGTVVPRVVEKTFTDVSEFPGGEQ